MSRPTVLLAGGGTGGHVFPLVAVAEALVKLRADLRVVFVGTKRGMETRFVPSRGFELELLDVLPLRGGGPRGALRGAIRAAQLIPRSRALLRAHQPRGVFSIGGYAAGPVSLAARTMGLPLAVMEPNSVIGLANRLIAPFVDKAFLAFPEAERHFAPSAIVRSGVPLRPGFNPQNLREQTGPLRILVLGGSQGAQALNELLPEALAQVRAPLSVVHQCGAAHSEAVEARYDALKKPEGSSFAQVTPFIDDMPQALAFADLIIGRSGASAVSEIAAIGRPSLLIPYPFASGDHQRINALSLQREGAAICLGPAEATVERMASEVRRLVEHRSRLVAMAQAARRLGRPHAADDIAHDFLQLCGLEGPETGKQKQAAKSGSGRASSSSSRHSEVV